MRGKKSESDFYKTFKALDVFLYQCSKYSTSTEIEGIFNSAIARQKSYDERKQDIQCVVFLDEAGLPKKEKQPLKVLHFYLDNPKVSFVGITNEPFDNAKANRVINVFRPEPATEELEILAKGCISTEQNNNTVSKMEEVYLKGFCSAYQELRSVDKNQNPRFPFFFNRFSLRDFYHCLRFFRRKAIKEGSQNAIITPEFTLQSLERNFNGVKQEEFETIVKTFFECIEEERKNSAIEMKSVLRPERKLRTQMECLRDSLADRHIERGNINDTSVRFKLVIDSSDDDSAARLMFQLGLLEPESTEVFELSEFPNDKTETAKHQIISKIKIAMERGSCVFLINASSIAGSFYDLFNQHYKEMKGNYYTNIAIGAFSRPCVVHPKFQVVFHLRESELSTTPMPFLNRFEKYLISVPDILGEQLSKNKKVKSVVEKVIERCEAFIKHVGEENFYGYVPKATVSSLFIDISQELSARQTAETIYDLTTEKIRTFATKLVQICSPESLVNALLPPHYLISYLDEQEHFSLNKLLKRRLFAENPVTTKEILFTTTTSQLVSIQKSRSAVLDADVNRESEIVEVSFLASEKEFVNKVDAFMEEDKRVFLATFDIQKATKSSLRIINRLRQILEEKISSVKDKVQTRHFLILIHFPSESLRIRKSSYPTLFLNGWDFHYLDQLGTPSSDTFTKHLLKQTAERFSRESESSVQEDPESQEHSQKKQEKLMLDSDAISKIFEEAVTSAICKLVPSNVGDAINWEGEMQAFYLTESTPGKRSQLVLELFEQFPQLKEAVLGKFKVLCSESVIVGVVQKLCNDIVNRVKTESLSSLLFDSLGSMFTSFIGALLEEICFDFNLQTLFSCSKKKSARKFVTKNFEALLPEIEIAHLLQKSNVVKHIPLSSFKKPPYCPFSSVLMKRINHLLDGVISEATKEEREDYSEICRKLQEEMKSDKFAAVFEHLQKDSETSVFQMYFDDLLESKLSAFPNQTKKEEMVIEKQKQAMSKWIFSEMGEKKNDLAMLHIVTTFEMKRWNTISLVVNSTCKHTFYDIDFPLLENLKTGNEFQETMFCSLIERLWKALLSIKGKKEEIENWLSFFREILNINQASTVFKGKVAQKFSLEISASSFFLASKCEPKLCMTFIEKISKFESSNKTRPNLKEQIEWVGSFEKDAAREFLEDLLGKVPEICSPDQPKKFQEDVKYLLELINQDSTDSFPSNLLSFSFKKFLFELLRKQIDKMKSNVKTGGKAMKPNDFFEFAREIVSESLIKKNPPRKFIPPVTISVDRVTSPIADIYFEVKLQEMRKNFLEKEELSKLFETLSQESQFSRQGEEFKAINKSAGECVLIEMLANAFCKKSQEIVHKVCSITKDKYDREKIINSIMKEKNNQLLLFSLVKNKKSIDRVEQIVKEAKLQEKFGDWLSEWKNRFLAQSDKNKFHRFSFMQYKEGDAESSHYFGMKNLLQDLIKDPNSAQIQNQLKILCEKYADGNREKLYKQRMFLTLLLYYEIFNENKTAPNLVNSLAPLFQLLEIDGKEKDILCCFVDPNSFSLPAARDDLGNFFSSRVDEDLLPARHSLISVLAAVMALPKNSNPLYTHIFNPLSLCATFGFGNQYDQPIGEISLCFTFFKQTKQTLIILNRWNSL